jgi:hypothetical protein
VKYRGRRLLHLLGGKRDERREPLSDAGGDPCRSLLASLRAGAGAGDAGAAAGGAGAMPKPTLTVEQILAWAEAYHARTGRWPTAASGPVTEAPGEHWGSLEPGAVAPGY